MFKLKYFLKDFLKEVTLGPAFKLIEAVFELIVPVIVAKLIDDGVKQGNSTVVITMGLILLLLGAIGLSSTLVCQKMASVASQGVGTNLRNKLFAHINTLSHSELDRFSTSSLITRLSNDVNQLQFAVAMLIRLVIRAPFLAVGSAIAAFIIDPALSLVFVIIIPVISLAIYFIMKATVPRYKNVQKGLDSVSLLTRENLQGVRVIRAFAKQKNDIKRFEDSSEELVKRGQNVALFSVLLNPLTFLIMNLGIVAIVWFGGVGVDSGRLTDGEIIAFINYINQMLIALVVVANLVITFTKAQASAIRVSEILDTKPSLVEGELEKVENNGSVAKIQFKDVSFCYGKSVNPAISKLNFSINKGETIGIIGGTGCGKSTLVSLIARFYDATSGQVLIDGVDAKQYTFKGLRKQIGYVPQKAVVFTGSIRENMKWADKNATDEKIISALKVAQGYEFVSTLKDGLDTQIKQGGQNVSGGQRQRLTIARAIVGDPKILILDDSSSALDTATDRKLTNALKELAQQKEELTTIIISQRVASVKHCDKIIVLVEGQMVAFDSHEKLLESCNEYSEICKVQLK